ncbi:MAG: ATP-binding protein [Pseudomonadota bacterium]
MSHEGTFSCGCGRSSHECKSIVFTGGPGAGKTAILDVAKRTFCHHVAVLPEAASIVYSGGFIRKPTPTAVKAVQRSIFRVAQQLEWLVAEEAHHALALCDRGTLDGLAYWPDSEDHFWRDVESTREKEFKRYSVVIHLRTPLEHSGYNADNPIRIETPQEALALDRRIEQIWEGHPRRFIISSTADFMEKTRQALDIVRNEIPKCCRLP